MSKMVKRLKNEIKRFLKIDKGAVAMEYIIIAILVVAAATGAAMYLGRSYIFGLKSAADIVTKRDVVNTSNEINEEGKNTATQGETDTSTTQNNIHNTSSGSTDSSNTDSSATSGGSSTSSIGG